MWARRLRKVGFSPVTIHHTNFDNFARPADGYSLRRNWPYDSANLPDDLYRFLSIDREGVPAIRTVYSRSGAVALLLQYRAVRVGMGSKPIPNFAKCDAWPPIVPATRIALDFADWPAYTQIHPDWEDFPFSASPVIRRLLE
jgi:hypothetical protein